MAKKRICGTCLLFDRKTSQCNVVILVEGQKVRLPVCAEDPCFFEQQCVNPQTGQAESFNEIQQVRMWVENDKGEQIDGDGTVKIEYPEDFFGKGLKKAGI
mgnify:CR=1 FL=1